MSPRRPSSFRAVALAGDLAIAVAVLYVAFYVRTHVAIPGTLTLLPGGNVRFTFWNIVIVAVVQAVSLSFFGLYRDHERFREPLGRLLLPALFFELATLASVYFLAQPYSFPRSVLVVYLVLNGLALAVWRAALDRIFPQPRRRAVIVGGGPAAVLIADTIRRHSWTGVELIGVVGEGDGGPGDLPVLGPVEDLFAIVEARVRPLDGAAGLFKRAFDAAAAAAALVLLAPGLGLAAVLVAATSPGGVFYRQTRVGRDGRLFELWKLRTMREGAEVETGAVLATADDPRITAIGRALRGARIDEIPQLWNVVRGDMSLVGPRPERPEFSDTFAKTVPGYGLRHAVRPGLTGLAQISGEYTSEPDIKLRYDLAYLNNWSFFLDLAILLRTLPVVLTRRGI